MMRKKVLLLPVGYHKIQAFYDTWLSDMPGAGFVSDRGALDAALGDLTPADHDPGALCRNHAIPAFDRFLMGWSSL